ncbi:Transcriptional regulatory protein [Sporothrix epigloea]|uniref:Transcriptional regulatory protein n=1 Tax=Sporothrix epigloea TaxID=1892477 RepID=A0ABP0DJ47_9PEZI
MAADDAFAAAAISSASMPPHAARSLSNVSSPLTEVEDKDGEPDDIDLDGPAHNSSSLSNVNLDDEDDDGSRAARSPSASDNDESALSDVGPDINDSEAETERLYDTPTKMKNLKDGTDADNSPESLPSPIKRLAAQVRDRKFQASPSKLKQQLHALSDVDTDNDDDDDDDDALTEAEDEENNEADGGEEAAAADLDRMRGSRRRSLTARQQAEKTAAVEEKEETPTPTPAILRQLSSSDTRKRKRSHTTDPSESDQPLRKRAGSGGGTAGCEANSEEISGHKAMIKRVNGAEPDDDTAETGSDDKADLNEAAEGTISDAFRARRSMRGSAKKHNSSDDGDEEANENDVLDGGESATVEEDAAGQGDDELLDGDLDDEAEAALRNEEELERKKAALENLHAIEKQFASFRDKLYQERLDQLNQEEEMLLGDNPTHPEYLAMMQCVNERRDGKIRVIDIEYELNTQTLKRWAVARRSHIHSQYFQSIRESRELILEELGRQWYQIQQQRRGHANTIPDYGLQFPASKIQQTKDAITYNKEVSILSGIAKYEGFPAAPRIKGASNNQVDDDLEAIARARQFVPVVVPVAANAETHASHSALPYPETMATPYNNGTHSNAASAVNGGSTHNAHNGNVGPVSFHSLGAAGQQFIADTPWANPHHPAHHAQRQQQSTPVSSAEPGNPYPAPSGHGPSPAPARRPLPQHGHQPPIYHHQARLNGDSAKAGQALGTLTSKRETAAVMY